MRLDFITVEISSFIIKTEYFLKIERSAFEVFSKRPVLLFTS